MNKELFEQLRVIATDNAAKYSNPEREHNYQNDVFCLDSIIPQSDTTAFVIYRKSSGLKVLFFYYHIRMNGGRWFYFVPTDSHILGMDAIKQAKREIEIYNSQIRTKVNT